MTTNELCGLFHIEDMKDLPQAVTALLDGDREKRDGIYRQMIAMNGYDLSYDWFQPLYEAELSERKQKKQDFTPRELGVLCSELTGQRGTVHEPTAGNGSMVYVHPSEETKRNAINGALRRAFR